jgi:hypothetical protein
MKFNANLIASLFLILSGLAVWTLIGCDRPQVGSPEYDDPILDTSPYEPAEEFTYLVDIEQTARVMGSNFQDIKEGMEGEGMPRGMEMPEFDSILEELGMSGLVKENITAEANESMIRAHGEYTIEDKDAYLIAGLSEIGTAEVRLPSYFPRDKWVGHVFIANPGDLVEIAMYAIETEMEAFMGGSGGMDMEMALGMFGFDDPEDVYNWMGDEFVLFYLLNEDFDPDGETTYENVPFFTVLGLASENTENGLDVIENLIGNPLLAMSGIDVDRDEFKGKDAVIISPPPADMFDDFLDEETMAQLEDAPDAIAVAVEDYILLADEFSMGAALDLISRDGSGTSRMASIEIESNLDAVLAQFDPSNPGPWVDFVESEEFQDLMMRLYNATRDLGELGTSRTTILIQDGENLDVDVLTSRESIRLFEIVEGIVAETPPETWQVLGEIFGETMAGQGGMGMEYDPDYGSPGKPDRNRDRNGNHEGDGYEKVDV